MSWRTGELVLKDLKYRRSKPIEQLLRQFWSFYEDKVSAAWGGEEGGCKVDGEFHYFDHVVEVDRDEEFGNRMRFADKKVQAAAGGRTIIAVPDEEWNDIGFFFGKEDEILAKLNRVLVRLKKNDKASKFSDGLTQELATELGNKFADVPGSGTYYVDRKWGTSSPGKGLDYVPNRGVFERNDGWRLEVSLLERTIVAQHNDHTKYNRPCGKEYQLTSVEEVEAFIKKIGPDIAKRPPTFSESEEEALYQLVKSIIGDDFAHMRDQGDIYFGGLCEACLTTTKHNFKHVGHLVHLSRERTGQDKGRLYLSVGNLSAYANPPDPVGYMDDAKLRENLIGALRKNMVALDKKIEDAKLLIENLNQAHDGSDLLLEQLRA